MSQENVELIRIAYNAWNKGAMSALCRDDVRHGAIRPSPSSETPRSLSASSRWA